MAGPPLIFIAYFGPDKPRAKALHRALSDRGFRPWCDAIDLLPGDLWDVVIPGKLRAARIIIVLISRTEHDGWYAREEIAEAIDAARRDSTRRVVPVLVDGATSKNAPYGLKRVNGIDVPGADYTPVVDGIARLFTALNESPPPAPTTPQPPSNPTGLDRAAIDHHAIVDAVIRRRLDRDLLLSWLPDGLRARLPHHRSYFEQMTSDVGELIRIGRLEDGQWAIAIWLRQAERLSGPFAEARVFRDALSRLP